MYYNHINYMDVDAMKPVQVRLADLQSQKKKLVERIKELSVERTKDRKKAKDRAVGILGRNVFAKLDSNNVKSYIDGMSASDIKSLMKCFSKLKPELNTVLEKSAQGKKS